MSYFPRCWRGFTFYLESEGATSLYLWKCHIHYGTTALYKVVSFSSQTAEEACVHTDAHADEWRGGLSALLSTFSWTSCPLVFRRSYFSNVLVDKRSFLFDQNSSPFFHRTVCVQSCHSVTSHSSLLSWQSQLALVTEVLSLCTFLKRFCVFCCLCSLEAGSKSVWRSSIWFHRLFVFWLYCERCRKM